MPLISYDQPELNEFAQFLIDTNELTTPEAVVEFYKDPSAYSEEFLVWENQNLKEAAADSL